MKLRARLNVNGQERALTLHPGLQETDDHLFLKLAAFLFFFNHEPTIETGATHCALDGQDYWPDLLKADLSGQVQLWIECGTTTLHKLGKVSKRFRAARVIILTPHFLQGRQQAKDVQAEGLRGIEVWSFPGDSFRAWRAAAKEQNEIIGETSETALNLVINNEPFMVDLERIL